MIVIDTDVILLAFAFHQDPRQPDNTDFLNHIPSAQPAITIYNLMEILGQLSFNLSSDRLDNWQSWLVDAYQLTVIWPINPNDPTNRSFFREEIFERPMTRMRTYKMPFMDSLILNLAERTPDVDQFITWNARHFRGKTSLEILTPEEYLLRSAL